MPHPEHREKPTDHEVFRGLLDEKFNLGKPRRHAPGQGLAEEEVFLEPSVEALSLLSDPPPKRVRAIRPKANNIAPVRRPSLGHRLEMLRRFDDGYSLYTVIYLGEGDTICRDEQASGLPLYERRPLLDTGTGITEFIYIPLGSPEREHNSSTVLDQDEKILYFAFIQGSAPREPNESE